MGHSDHVTCVAVSILNKSLVVSGSRDANLIVWDINTGNDIHVLTGHLGYVTCVKVTGDGSLAVSGKLMITSTLNFSILCNRIQSRTHPVSQDRNLINLDIILEILWRPGSYEMDTTFVCHLSQAVYWPDPLQNFSCSFLPLFVLKKKGGGVKS